LGATFCTVNYAINVYVISFLISPPTTEDMCFKQTILLSLEISFTI